MTDFDERSLTLRDVSRLLIKISGAVIVTFVLTNIPSYVSYFLTLQEKSLLLYLSIAVLPMLIPLLAGIAMWKWADKISDKVVLDAARLSNDSDILIGLQRTAFVLLGVYLASEALADGIYYLARWHQMSIALSKDVAMEPDTYGNLFAITAKLVFSVFLVFGSKSLASALKKVRRQ